MKKLRLFTLFILCLSLLAGCKKGNLSLSLGDLNKNTIYVDDNGNTETVIVDDFEKDYYDKDELESFINEEITKYNGVYGEDAVKLNDLDVKDMKVKAAFSYKDMDTYASFSRMDAKFMTVKEAENQGLLPQTMLHARDGKEVDKSEILEKAEYKVVVLNEKYDVLVDGKIKYYTAALPINSRTVQTTGEETAVIVFK